MKAFIAKITTPESVAPVLERARKHALEAVKEGMHEVVIRKATKSRDQECKAHAMIADIAEQYQHAGRQWAAEDLKRLLVDAFKHETLKDPEFAHLWQEMGETRVVPAIGRDGFVVLGEQTRRFPAKLASGFMDWLAAFAAEHHIAFSDPESRSLQEAYKRG